ncbi:hypothetical protein V6N13_011902 [Hibiscus sabdariffa]
MKINNFKQPIQPQLGVTSPIAARIQHKHLNPLEEKVEFPKDRINQAPIVWPLPKTSNTDFIRTAMLVISLSWRNFLFVTLSDDHNPQSRAFQRHKNRGVRFGFSPEAEIDEDDQQGGETSPRHMDSISVGAVSRSDHEKVVDLYVDTFGVMIGIWIFLPHRCMFPPIDGKALKGYIHKGFEIKEKGCELTVGASLQD